ncbi:hypothetical protein TNIN_249871, partial [Trichonephila inaurata madagascariensis]
RLIFLRGLFAKQAKSKSSVEEQLMPFLRPQPPIFNGDFTNGVIHQENFYDSQLLVFEIWSPSSTASPTTSPLPEKKTDDLLDTAKESLVDPSNNSWFDDKGDAIHFSNVDFEANEPAYRNFQKFN